MVLSISSPAPALCKGRDQNARRSWWNKTGRFRYYKISAALRKSGGQIDEGDLRPGGTCAGAASPRLPRLRRGKLAKSQFYCGYYTLFSLPFQRFASAVDVARQDF